MMSLPPFGEPAFPGVRGYARIPDGQAAPEA